MIGRKYAKEFIRKENGEQDFTLEELAAKKHHRQILSQVWPILVTMGKIPDLDQMTKEERKEIWEFAKPYCGKLNDSDKKEFIQSMMVIGVLLP